MCGNIVENNLTRRAVNVPLEKCGKTATNTSGEQEYKRDGELDRISRAISNHQSVNDKVDAMFFSVISYIL